MEINIEVKRIIKLLLVDDEEATRNGLLKHIPWKQLGVDSIKQAANGIEALALAEAYQPDIVLSDIRMPVMNGIDFSARIAALYPECKLIYMSGYSDKEYMMNAIDLRVVGYVEKPIVQDEMKRVIRKAVTLCVHDRNQREAAEHHSQMRDDYIPMLHQKLVLSLINPLADKTDIAEKLEAINTNFNTNSFYHASLIKFRLLKNKDNNDFDTMDAISVAFSNFKYLSALKSENHVILILDSGIGAWENEINTSFTHLKEICTGSSEVFCAAGMGVLGLANIHESYRSAETEAQKLFYHGYGFICLNSDEHKTPGALDASEIYKGFIRCLATDDENHIRDFFNNLLKKLVLHDMEPPNNIRKIFIRLLAILEQEIDSRKLLGIDNKTDSLEIILNKETLNDICTFLYARTLSMFEQTHELDATSRVAIQVMGYIRNHCSNPDLSLKELSEFVHLTPSYLSALFKKTTKKTISDFITESRIEKSKQYLLDSGKKIYEIAQSVGYIDANYYAKTFRRITGIGPSDYRENHGL